jgi:major type 1 subunit fimbrin (pilin)
MSLSILDTAASARDIAHQHMSIKLMKRTRFVLAAVALLSATRAFAVDATFTFTGDIIVPTCTISANTANQTIKLDTARMQDFASIGSTGRPVAFNLQLNNCVPTTIVSMTVGGTTDTVASVLKNTGTATQIGVQVLKAAKAGDVTGTPVQLNSLLSLGTVDNTNAMTIPMVAQYYRLGAMTAGSVTAVATLNFTYN